MIPKSTARQITLIGILILLTLGISYLDSLRASRAPGSVKSISVAKSGTTSKSLRYAQAKELVSAGKFINAAPFTLQSLIGKKVILLDFWTYSCINCQRTTPYLNAWYEKYKDAGLVIIGIHTPEFDFEKEYENVLLATRKMGIRYPVVQDNDYGTWNAYSNLYWPRKYLIDIDGYVEYDHVGEGGYEETEAKIQELLAERKASLGEISEIPGGFVTPENVTRMEPGMVKSPEVYFGAARNTHLANGKAGEVGVQPLTLPTSIDTNELYLEGNWGFRDEFSYNTKAPAKIVYRYSAKNVYFVASAESNTEIEVILDGKRVTAAEAGEDVKNGILTVKEDRLYKVIHTEDYGEHTLELRVRDSGLRAFTFTFG